MTVASVAEEFAGAGDSDILEYSVQNGLLLLTEDGDFGELVFTHGELSVGVLFIRYARSEEREITESLLRVIDSRAEQLRGSFTVITPRKVRTRPLP